MNKKELSEFLSYASKTPDDKAELLINKYGNFLSITEDSMENISETIGNDMPTAFYIKLATALASRRVCDRFKFGKKHTEEQIQEYFTGLLFGLPIETVYALFVDKLGKCILCERVGEGTVNYSNILPRKIIETARKCNATGVILAHNHPGGYANPSDDDRTSAMMLSEILAASEITLLNSYVVAGSECAKTNIERL